MSEKIIVSVISDLVTDQRVQRECITLHKMGYEVLLLGRKSLRNFNLEQLPYKTLRFKNLFNRGPLMYLVFNAQLFFFLFFKKADILWANDLDTLLPNFLISKLKGERLIYDSHEYFTESVYKHSSKKWWEKLEKKLFPRLKNVITVNESIKKIYSEKYNVPVTVVRNVPFKYKGADQSPQTLFPAGKKILLIQGTGINENRGAEEAVAMMQYLGDEFNLYFIGAGTLWEKLKNMADELHLQKKVFFIDTKPYLQMMEYTRQAFLGLIFEKIHHTDEHLYSLPNKFFDYLHAGLPVLSSHAVEIETIINKYQVGTFIDSFSPEAIAKKIEAILQDNILYNAWKQNTVKASAELNWENEEKVLIRFMKDLS